MRLGRGGRVAAALSAAALVGCHSVGGPPMSGGPPSIVFDWVLNGGAQRNIFRAFLDGTDTLRLSSAADDEHPSARAGTVVFTSYRDGNGELYAMHFGGGSAVRVTNTAANETQPALSPDATKIAYVSDVSGVTKLWMSATNGFGAQPLTAGFGFAGAVEASPSWAPDGKRIVFVSTVNGSADLFVLSLSGGAPMPLVVAPSADVEPAWSPDGSQVAFASDRSSGGATNIYVVNVATGIVTQATTGGGPDGQPGWLPDGRLIYTTWVANTPRLKWLDLADASTGDVPLAGGGDVQRAVGVF